MAILYGTTGTGETLPVEVNEFGQLIAEGLDGPPGPPGPPGIGQLPPDPFEGAILGWKDNTLSWLGGSVPLPEGTYGPILNYANGVLTLESSVELPYQTAIFLSDALGERYSYVPRSSPITNVSGNVLTVFNDLDFDRFQFGDVVQQESIEVNVNYSNNGQVKGSPGIQEPANIFDGIASPDNAVEPTNSADNFILWTPSSPVSYNSLVEIYTYQTTGFGITCTYSFNGGAEVVYGESANAWGWWPVSTGSGNITSIRIRLQRPGQSSACGWAAVRVDGNILVNGTKTEFVDYKITGIDASVPSITTDGGSWQPGQVISTGAKSGEGTVQSTSGKVVVCGRTILSGLLVSTSLRLSKILLFGMYMDRKSGTN